MLEGVCFLRSDAPEPPTTICDLFATRFIFGMFVMNDAFADLVHSVIPLLPY